jgi:hypothetical protein
MSSQFIIAASPIQKLILSATGAEQGRECHAG